ncbi:proton-coupled amino acid transporter 1-like isoform X2 [Styela clava]
MHLIKGSIGPGLLMLPWGVRHAGIIAGPIYMVLIALINMHCMQILVKSSRYLCKKLNLSALDYGDLGYYSVLYGPIQRLQPHASKARIFVNACLVLTQFGICCVFVLFVGQNIRQVFAVYWENIPGNRVFMALLIIPVILLTLIENLPVLAWFSTAANAAILISVGMILRYLTPNLPPVTSRPFIAEITDFPLFVGGVIYAFEGIGVILPLENAMRTPEYFPKIIYIGMTMISILYIVFGFIGYLKFGSKACGSITLNLPITPFYETARILYSFALFVTYPLQFYVIMEIIRASIDQDSKLKTKYLQWTIKALIATFSCVCAIAVPSLGNYISLVGTTVTTTLAIILPAVIETLTFYEKAGTTYQPIGDVTAGDASSSDEENERNEKNEESPAYEKLRPLELCKNAFIITFGTIAVFVGSAAVLKSIILTMKHYNPEHVCSGGVAALKNTTYFNSTIRLGVDV